ncbi:nuclear transport factor 2 family protein [Saccharomonospora sp. NPDC006951]
MTSIETRLASLERRLREAEDRLALLHIVASYGPAVDSGSAEATAAIWTEDGCYDSDPAVFEGRRQIAEMVLGPRHQGLIGSGAAHLIGIPHIALDGDKAVVTTYSQLVLRDQDGPGFRVARTGVNRWEFVRTGEGWKVRDRVNRQLGGGAPARALAASAVNPAPES